MSEVSNCPSCLKLPHSCLQWKPPYGHLSNTVTSFVIMAIFSPWQNGHTFSHKKPSLMCKCNNKAKSLILKSQTVEYFIQPLVQNLENEK